MAVLGGLVGLGAGMAFVGRAVVVVGGVLGLLGRGIPPSSLWSDDWKENFVCWGRVGGVGIAWGGVWGGGGGRPPPLLPLADPAPSHASPHLHIPPPPRIPHLLHTSPLPAPEVARRHPYTAQHA